MSTQPNYTLLKVVVFADICGSTALYHKLGDREASRIVGECMNELCRIVRVREGTVVKTIGDEVMATFDQASDAIFASMEMQVARPLDQPEVKVGINRGAVVLQDGDVFGDTVNIAARVVGRAREREILMTEAVRAALPGDVAAGTVFIDRAAVKGVDAEISMYRYPTDVTETGVAEPEPLAEGPATAWPRALPTLTLTYAGEVFRFSTTDGAITVGRKSDCAVTVPGEWVSRRHMVITFERDRYMIEDISTHGTFLKLAGEMTTELKRVKIALLGRGEIGLGSRPSAGNSLTLSYEVN